MAESERTCESCRCTDPHACLDPVTGQGCYWIEGFSGHLCSTCARLILVTASENPVIDPEWGPALRITMNRLLSAPPEPFIVIADGPEADRLIREIRAGGPLS